MVIRLLSLCGMLLLAAHASAADIQAHVNANPVPLNESFTLTLEATGSPDADPDLGVLEQDFEILNRAQSSQIQIINGQMQQRKQWQLTLMARRAGEITIPAVPFGADASQPIRLRVEEAGATEPGEIQPLILESSLEPDIAYVQSQLVLRVRLLRAINLQTANLSEPEITGVEAIVEQLGEDRSFETSRNGVRYLGVERNYAIYPQTSGELHIAPIRFQGQVLSGARSFFSDGGSIQRLHTAAHQRMVRAIPADATRPWLPAREVTLEEDWPQQDLRVGEPITRTLRIRARGLAAEQLPELSPALPDGLRQYPDQPLLENQAERDTLSGSRTQKTALIASRAGTFVLPAIELAWWNLDTGQEEIARLPARTIEVLPAPSDHINATPAPAAPTSLSAPIEMNSYWWQWLVLGLLAGWASASFVWCRLRPRRPSLAATQTSATARADLRAVRAACAQNDADACHTALLQWGRRQWPQQPPGTLQALAQCIGGEAAVHLQALARARYAQGDSGWDGAALWQALSSWSPAPAGEKRQSVNLAPLYPQ